jgi:hypothetical protein
METTSDDKQFLSIKVLCILIRRGWRMYLSTRWYDYIHSTIFCLIQVFHRFHWTVAKMKFDMSFHFVTLSSSDAGYCYFFCLRIAIYWFCSWITPWSFMLSMVQPFIWDVSAAYCASIFLFFSWALYPLCLLSFLFLSFRYHLRAWVMISCFHLLPKIMI